MTGCASRIGFFLIGVSLIAVGVAAAVNPVAVKTSARNEIRPAVLGDWLAWSESRAARPRTFDVWAQRGAAAPVKVNIGGTQGYTGGIDGSRLVYQQIRRRQSDLRLYDLIAGKHDVLKAGINTRGWEWHPTVSNDWLLFGRGRPFTRAAQTIVLRNLVTGEQRVLDRLRSRRGILAPGQVQGSFAVWMRCSPHPQCRIMRYEASSRTTVQLPSPAGKIVYSPAVNASGTTYYGRSAQGCGNGVELVKHTIAGPAQVLVSLPAGEDLKFAYATTTRGKPPRELTITRVYYDRVVCRRNAWDIYRADDIERPPPPIP
jgi:hypothetical protein